MADNRIETLVVPVDGSDGAAGALRFASQLGTALGIPMHVVFAFPRDALDMFGAPAEMPTTEQLKYFSEDAFKQLRDNTADRVFAHARGVLAEQGATAEEHVLSGDPAQAVLDYAEKMSSPMIIVGRRGLSRFSELLLGSVSQRLVHHASCPVTVVR